MSTDRASFHILLGISPHPRPPKVLLEEDESPGGTRLASKLRSVGPLQNLGMDGNSQSHQKTSKLASFRGSHGLQSHRTVLNQLHGDAPAFVERNREHVDVVLDIADRKSVV